jgi:hypothetical protein
LYKISDYDKFLPLGHLSLYKNTDENNHRYKLSGSRCGDYVMAFSNEKNRAFDEENGMGAIFDTNDMITLPYFNRVLF